jgi:hypothetical protein
MVACWWWRNWHHVRKNLRSLPLFLMRTEISLQNAFSRMVILPLTCLASNTHKMCALWENPTVPWLVTKAHYNHQSTTLYVPKSLGRHSMETKLKKKSSLIFVFFFMIYPNI